MNSNLTLFYGDNQHNLKKEVSLWKHSFFQKYPNSSNFSEFKNPEKEIAEIRNEIQSPPFLEDKRLIFIYNLQGSLEDKIYKKFIKLLENLPDTSIVLCIEENKLAKNAKLLNDFKKLGQVKEFTISTPELITTSNKLLQKLGKKIQPNLLKELVLKLENNPHKIENELTKLALFTESDEISSSDINLLVKFSLSASVFELMDLISYKKIQPALNTLNGLLESGEEPTKIFYLLARQIRILIQLLSLKNQKIPDSEIAKLTGLHPFIIKKTLPSLKNFTLPKLEKTLTQILKIDTDLKTGQIKYSKTQPTEMLIALEMLLLEI